MIIVFVYIFPRVSVHVGARKQGETAARFWRDTTTLRRKPDWFNSSSWRQRQGFIDWCLSSGPITTPSLPPQSGGGRFGTVQHMTVLKITSDPAVGSLEAWIKTTGLQDRIIILYVHSSSTRSTQKISTHNTHTHPCLREYFEMTVISIVAWNFTHLL